MWLPPFQGEGWGGDGVKRDSSFSTAVIKKTDKLNRAVPEISGRPFFSVKILLLSHGDNNKLYHLLDNSLFLFFDVLLYNEKQGHRIFDLI